MSDLRERQYGKNYSENIVDTLLMFDSGTWTVAGTGTATLDATNRFVSNKCLKIENNTPSANITASNSTQSTAIEIDNDYQFSCYIKKDTTEDIEGAVLIYKNAVLLETLSFTLDEESGTEWARIQSPTKYTLQKDDVITFQFRLGISSTTDLSTVLYVDGVMLNYGNRNNTIVPTYSKPDRFKDLPDLPSADGNYQLTVASGFYTWTEIV